MFCIGKYTNNCCTFSKCVALFKITNWKNALFVNTQKHLKHIYNNNNNMWRKVLPWPQKAVIHVVKTFASGGKVPLWLGCGPWSGQKLERHLRPTLYSPPRSGSPMSQLTLILIYSQKARWEQTEYNYNNTDGFPLYQAHIICTVQF